MLKDVVKRITKASLVDKKLVNEIIRDIQRALIKADVNVRLVKEISDAIKKRASEEEPLPYLSPKEHVLKIVYEELIKGLGDGLDIPLKKCKIMLIGLHGSGKTTTAVKLAKYFKDRGLSSAVICLDTWRPAAYDQLKQLAESSGIKFYGDKNSKNPVDIVKNLKASEDVLIFDTAGRHSLETSLIKELKELDSIIKPNYKLLVIDAALGQLAGKHAKDFDNLVGVDGIIITKFDGTAKGGGALSAAKITGVPIAFLGTGEKIDDFEKFDPKSFVSRLLGMGDIKTLIEKAERVAKEVDLESILKGKFTLKELYSQIDAMLKMGPISKIIELLPFGLSLKIDENRAEITQEKLKKFKVIMDSMTDEELLNPQIIDSSRIRRIAIGSGTSPHEVKELLNYYRVMKSLMKRIKRSKFKLPKFGF